MSSITGTQPCLSSSPLPLTRKQLYNPFLSLHPKPKPTYLSISCTTQFLQQPHTTNGNHTTPPISITTHNYRPQQPDTLLGHKTNLAIYTSTISAYAKCHRESEAISLFFQMRLYGFEPDEFAFVAVLTACIRLRCSQLGSQIHALVIKTGCILCVYVLNALMAMYVKSSVGVDLALQLFDEMPQRDVASWNTVIAGLVQGSMCERAFELFRDMQIEGFRADQYSLSSLVTASGEIFAWRKGGEIHAHGIRTGFEWNLSFNNALLSFYTKCGRVQEVVGLFERMPVKDVISWTGMVTGYLELGLVDSAVEIFNQMPVRNCVSYNALLAGFCQNGDGFRALKLFQGMVKDGVELSYFTLTIVINSCVMLSEKEISEQIHGFVIKVGSGSNDWIDAALLDMCSKCGRMADAQKIFDRWVHDQTRSIACTSMICGYTQNGQHNEAMSLFCTMQREGEATMDEVASATGLGVCGTIGFQEKGKEIHCYALKTGFLSDLAVGNALFSMYSKCGNMEDALKIFNLMPEHDVVSWNALINGYLLDRRGDEALDVWSKMEKMVSIKPDSITFALILSACRHTKSNSVDACRSLFHSMRSCYSIEPASEHYATMINVLGYWGCFEEAEELIKKMPFKPNASIWRALLEICRLRSNINLGRQAVQHLLALELQDPSTYMLVSNLYSASGRWHCSEKVREEMRQKGLHKHPARSWVIHQNAIHSFYARDRLHPQSKDIYSGLEILILECLKVGYVPNTSFVLHEVEEYQKKDFLFYHSAKLAATYGLLKALPGRPVHVVKNIRLCGDCHTFLKYVSTVTGREINLRDATGFHCFRSGECSCADNW